MNGASHQRVSKPDPVWRDHPSQRNHRLRRDHVLRSPAAYLDLAGPGHRSYLALHQVGFTRPPRHRDAGALLPHLFTIACAPHEAAPSAVSFLWHFPAGFPGWE